MFSFYDVLPDSKHIYKPGLYENVNMKKHHIPLAI
jgi:hypothetical protein